MIWVAGGVIAAVVVLGLMVVGLAQANMDEAEWNGETD